MFAHCRHCLHVYNLAHLYGERPWRTDCPECGAPLASVPPQSPRRLEERRPPEPAPEEPDEG